MTSYVAALALARSGVWSRAVFYADLAKNVQELQEQPGHLVTSAEMSSFLTWNRPDNAANAMISYYTKGQILGTMLDLDLRARTGNRRSLDDAFRTMSAEFGLPKPGFPEDGGFEAVMNRMAAQGGASGTFQEFFTRHVKGLDEIAYDSFLAHVGLKLQVDRASPVRSLGVTTRTENDRLFVDNVPPTGAGYDAGLMPGDALLSMDGERVVPSTFIARLNVRKAGDTVNLQVMRGDRQVMVPLSLQENRAPTYKIVEDPAATDAAKTLRDQWLSPSTGK
jgi:predicted metalloprotease with PDZ domain